jgi:hypothetical protein
MKLIPRSRLNTELESNLVALAGEAAHKASAAGHSAAIAFADDGWAIVVAISSDHYRSRIVRVADPANGIVFLHLDAALAIIDEPETHGDVLGYVGRTNVAVFSRKELASMKVRHAIEDLSETGSFKYRRDRNGLLRRWFASGGYARTTLERMWTDTFGDHIFDSPEFRKMALDVAA